MINSSYEWESLPTGFSNTVTPMFPEPIYIPAVKDLVMKPRPKKVQVLVN
jgi:hypothetical protein